MGQMEFSDCLDNNSVELITSDIREIQNIPDILSDVNCVVHLAAVVGEPLCKKNSFGCKTN